MITLTSGYLESEGKTGQSDDQAEANQTNKALEFLASKVHNPGRVFVLLKRFLIIDVLWDLRIPTQLKPL